MEEEEIKSFVEAFQIRSFIYLQIRTDMFSRWHARIRRLTN
jgi:hypothetical protein